MRSRSSSPRLRPTLTRRRRTSSCATATCSWTTASAATPSRSSTSAGRARRGGELPRERGPGARPAARADAGHAQMRVEAQPLRAEGGSTSLPPRGQMDRSRRGPEPADAATAPPSTSLSWWSRSRPRASSPASSASGLDTGACRSSGSTWRRRIRWSRHGEGRARCCEHGPEPALPRPRACRSGSWCQRASARSGPADEAGPGGSRYRHGRSAASLIPIRGAATTSSVASRRSSSKGGASSGSPSCVARDPERLAQAPGPGAEQPGSWSPRRAAHRLDRVAPARAAGPAPPPRFPPARRRG